MKRSVLELMMLNSSQVGFSYQTSFVLENATMSLRPSPSISTARAYEPAGSSAIVCLVKLGKSSRQAAPADGESASPPPPPHAANARPPPANRAREAEGRVRSLIPLVVTVGDPPVNDGYGLALPRNLRLQATRGGKPHAVLGSHTVPEE